MHCNIMIIIIVINSSYNKKLAIVLRRISVLIIETYHAPFPLFRSDITRRTSLRANSCQLKYQGGYLYYIYCMQLHDIRGCFLLLLMSSLLCFSNGNPSCRNFFVLDLGNLIIAFLFFSGSQYKLLF